MPVGLSLKGDLLQFSQPQWVASLRLGVKLILWSMVVMVVGVILSITLAVLLHRRSMQSVLTLVIFAGGVISFAGSWLLTNPDPSGLGEDQYGTSRKLIRIGLAVGLGNYAISFVKSIMTLPPVPALMLEWLSTGVELFALVGSFALLNYLSKLALRIPAPKLSARAKFLMYAMCGSQLLLLMFGHIVQRVLLPMAGGVGGQTLMLFNLISAAIGICMFVFAILYLVLLLDFNKQLRKAADGASLIWQIARA